MSDAPGPDATPPDGEVPQPPAGEVPQPPAGELPQPAPAGDAVPELGTDAPPPAPDAGSPAPPAEPTGPSGTAPGSGRRSDRLAAALIGVLTLLLGFAFAVQVRTVGDDNQYAGAREEDLVRILDELNAREERLRQQLADQRSALQDLSSSDSQTAAAVEEARRRSEAIGILNGTIAARGAGLRMTIHDPDQEVRVADILDAVQELRGAGAETMQIDDVRVGVSTAVTGQPGDLMIDGHPISAPYEVLVIGSPQDMETALNIPGGVVQDIGNRGGTVDIAQSRDVVVDALRPLEAPQYASPKTAD
ncbi:MAG: hypothetical protein JWQ45_2800 [Blastococcus sp.]|nr:hypothetical protein [Blastococcus sp.]